MMGRLMAQRKRTKITLMRNEWLEFNEDLYDYTEKMAADRLDMEKNAESPRPQYILRSYQKLSALRRAREIAEITAMLVRSPHRPIPRRCTEAQAIALYEMEINRNGARSKRLWLIYSMLTRLRAKRERAELRKIMAKKKRIS